MISGCIGPRGDGYKPDSMMSAGEAEAYHARQIRTFRGTDADMVTAITMNYADEAIGIARAAAAADMPVAISFTVETDGRLATGQPLGEAIEMVDDASGRAPAYYMINCAHPTHFAAEFAANAPWVDRLRGLRANASRLQPRRARCRDRARRRATPRSSAGAMPTCADAAPRSPCSAAAAAPIIATSPRSASPAWRSPRD